MYRCERKRSIIRLIYPRSDPDGDLVEAEWIAVDHFFILIFLLAYILVTDSIFAFGTVWLVPGIAMCLVLGVFLAVYHCLHFRTLSQELADAHEDAPHSAKQKPDDNRVHAVSDLTMQSIDSPGAATAKHF